MWNRKNFLIFAVILNCVYFIGVSVLVTRHISGGAGKHELNSWVEEGTQLITQNLLLDQAKKTSMLAEIGRPQSEQKIKIWTQPYNIVDFIELKKSKSFRDWIGSRKDIPFAYSDLHETNSVGFSRKDDRLFFSYVLENSDFSFFIKQEKTAESLKAQLSAFGMEVTIVESETNGGTRVLYTNLPNPMAEHLLEQTDFEAPSIDRDFTLQQEKYYVKSIQLVHSEQLKQKMLFSKKIAHFQVVSLTDILIYVWTFFCISVLLNLLLFRFGSISEI